LTLHPCTRLCQNVRVAATVRTKAELGDPVLAVFASDQDSRDQDSRSNIVSFGGVVLLNPGDHVAIYASKAELADAAGEFLADGLRKSERCWYHENAFYDAGVQTLRTADPVAVNAKLAALEGDGRNRC
jgi:hypothetical protein